MAVISDIMSPHVAKLWPENTVSEAVNLLTEHHIGGAPVVADDGSLLGMISELALIDVVFDADVKNASVAEYMEPNVQCVRPDEPLARAAQLFALYSFRRLPVVERGRLVGIVSRRDLMNHALRTNELLTEPLVELVSSFGQIS